MSMDLDHSSVGLALRLMRNSLDRYVWKGELAPDDAARLLREVDRIEGAARQLVAAQTAVQASADLTDTGKQAQWAELRAQANTQLEPLRVLARQFSDAAEDFTARADRFEQQPDGTWRERPTSAAQPTEADRADWREIRASLAGRDVHEIRRLYLSDTERHSHTAMTRAIEADPARDVRPEPWLDPVTMRRAQELRRERSGIRPHVTRAQTAATAAVAMLESLERELGVEPARPAPERVTA